MKIFGINFDVIRVYFIFPAGSVNLLVDNKIAFQVAGALSTQAHPHHYFGNIFIGYFIGLQETYEQFKIGRNLIIGFEQAKLCITLLFEENSRMRRHDSESEFGWFEIYRTIESNDFFRVVPANNNKISENTF